MFVYYARSIFHFNFVTLTMLYQTITGLYALRYYGSKCGNVHKSVGELLMMSTNNLPQPNAYDHSYFAERSQNDTKRLRSFEQEKSYLSRFAENNGTILDIGCSTGEFLSSISWQGVKYGLEISEYAKSIALESGIHFDDDVFEKRDTFDIVVYRGTIQHLPSPFEYLQSTFSILRPGGIVVFLATPNSNSVVYKMCNTLPALDPNLNYWIPSDITLKSNLENIGFRVIDTSYPYIGSPYANPFMDHFRFLMLMLGRRQPKFAFWRNMMNVVARKPNE